MAHPHEFIGLKNDCLRYLDRTEKYNGSLQLICIDTVKASDELMNGYLLRGRLIQAIKGLKYNSNPYTEYQNLLNIICDTVENINNIMNYFNESHFKLISYSS